MKRIEPYIYEVVPHEVVSFLILPDGTPGFVTAAENGHAIANSDGLDHPTYSFPIVEDPGNSHFAILEFTFTPDDDATAKFGITVHSSNGESFPERPVRKDDPSTERQFEFKVK